MVRCRDVKLHPFSDDRSKLLTLLLLLTRVWFITGVILWAGQEVVLFPGLYLRAFDDPATAAEAMGATVQYLPSDDGGVCTLWRVTAGADRVVLMVHGNGEVNGDLLGYTEALAAAGWDWAAVEIRGFGDAPGWPGERAGAADMRRALAELRLQYPSDRIVVHGRSIGGGLAVAGIQDQQVGGLVLESTFDSLAATAASRMPMYPMGLLLRHPMDTASYLNGRPLPVLQVHDKTDRVVNIGRARRLREVLVKGSWIETNRWPHGTPIVLMDVGAKSRWLAWLNVVVPPHDPVGGRP